MSLHPFVVSLLGGVLIGGSAAWLFASAHKIAGISGILGGLLDGADDRGFRLAFLSGLLLTGVAVGFAAPALVGPSTASIGRIVAGGLLVGFGTRLGNGCTSGHGVCGISRLSPRSLLATMTFVGVGMLTVAVSRAVLGGAS